jgi:hypothetical protein
MEHGKDHDERQQKARAPRANNTPKGDPEVELEAQLSDSKRGGAVPPQGVIGAHLERPGYSEKGASAAEGEEPVGGGTDTAPTEKALERERERHRRERELGHIPAGEEGRIRAANGPGATREALDNAAREADRAVGVK